MSAGKAVAGAVAAGTMFIVATAVADVIPLAAVGLVAGIVLFVAMAVLALAAWAYCFRQASDRGDGGWMFDLLTVPALATVSALLLARPVAAWVKLHGTTTLDGQTGLGESLGLLVLGAIGLALFVGCAIGTVAAIGSENRVTRILVAYPGFVFYGIYVSSAVISFTQGT